MRLFAIAVTLLLSSVVRAEDLTSYGHFVLSYGLESHPDGVLVDLDSNTPVKARDGGMPLSGPVIYLGGASGFVAGGWRLSLLSNSESTGTDQTARFYSIAVLNFAVGPSIPIPLYHVHPALAARVTLEFGASMPIQIVRGTFGSDACTDEQRNAGECSVENKTGFGIQLPVRVVGQVHFKPFLLHLSFGRGYSLANLLASHDVAQPWLGEVGLGLTF